MRLLKILSGIGLLSLLSMPLTADKIITIEGREILCTILEINQLEVKILAEDVMLIIPRFRIKEVEKEEKTTAAPSVAAMPTPTLEVLTLPPLTSLVEKKESVAPAPLPQTQAKPVEAISPLPATPFLVTQPSFPFAIETPKAPPGLKPLTPEEGTVISPPALPTQPSEQQPGLKPFMPVFEAPTPSPTPTAMPETEAPSPH